MLVKVSRLSLEQGFLLCTVGLLFGLAALLIATRVRSFAFEIVLFLVAWVSLWFFSHDLAHHLVGRLVGVQFRYYFIGRSAVTRLKLPIVSVLLRKVPILGLKIDQLTLRSVSVEKVQVMYASGAITSMILPWLVVVVAFESNLLLGITFATLSLGNALFTIYFSARVGDLYRARRVQDINQ